MGKEGIDPEDEARYMNCRTEKILMSFSPTKVMSKQRRVTMVSL